MVIFVRRAAGDVTEEMEPSACNYAGEWLVIRVGPDFIIGYVAGLFGIWALLTRNYRIISQSCAHKSCCAVSQLLSVHT